MNLALPRFLLAIVTAWFSIVVPVFASESRQPKPVNILQLSRKGQPICTAELGPALDQIVARPVLKRARSGILVQRLGSKQPLYAREAEQFFLPASTTKVLTTAAALVALGADYRIETPVLGRGELPNLDALKVIGQGDPSFADQDLSEIAKTLHQQGVRRINNLIGDDSIFSGSAVVPSWEWEDLQAGWGSPVNSLMVNENAYEVRLYPQAVGKPLKLEWQHHEPTVPWRLINRSRTVTETEPEFTRIVRRFNEEVLEIEVFGQLRVGGGSDRSWIAVIDPGPYFLRRLRFHLERQNIQVARTTLITEPVAKNVDRSDEKVLTVVQSPPLSELIYTINQYSNNLYAEAVLKTLGRQHPAMPESGPSESSLDLGLKILKQTLTKMGVDPDTYEVFDGSGLSRHNLVSPEALVQTLEIMNRLPEANIFRKSLKSRTLANLSPDTVLVKTGSMTGVSNLSGYVRRDDPLAFSIFFNQYNQPRSQLNPIFDEILSLLSHLKSCP